jgi:hypothetical protein
MGKHGRETVERPGSKAGTIRGSRRKSYRDKVGGELDRRVGGKGWSAPADRAPIFQTILDRGPACRHGAPDGPLTT